MLIGKGRLIFVRGYVGWMAGVILLFLFLTLTTAGRVDRTRLIRFKRVVPREQRPQAVALPHLPDRHCALTLLTTTHGPNRVVELTDTL